MSRICVALEELTYIKILVNKEQERTSRQKIN